MENYNDIRKGQFKLLLFLLSAIFLIMLVITIIFEINYYNKYGFFKRTTAEVTAHEEIDGVLHDVLEYDAFGVTYIITAERESQNNVGDKFTIYFDENNPIGIIYSLDYRRVMLPTITLIVQFIDVVLILYYARRFDKLNIEDLNDNFEKTLTYRVNKSSFLPNSKVYKQHKIDDIAK